MNGKQKKEGKNMDSSKLIRDIRDELYKQIREMSAEEKLLHIAKLASVMNDGNARPGRSA